MNGQNLCPPTDLKQWAEEDEALFFFFLSGGVLLCCPGWDAVAQS